jgi:hypothetical protein
MTALPPVQQQEVHMHMTEHMKARMGQRGIKKDLVELVLDHGEVQGDRYVLTARACRALISTLRAQQKRLEDISRKGGITVAVEGEALITAFRTDSFSISAARQSRG